MYHEPINPCIPSPCGPYSECRAVGETPSCSCRPNYVGSPPNCRPECIINQECPSNKACIQEKCRDPCPGSCGFSAQCSIINHTPICTCPEGYTGDPFTNCVLKPPSKNLFYKFLNSFVQRKILINNKFLVIQPVEEADPCNPSPCGPNANCHDGICTCIPEYQGDPYAGCRPECILSTDCPKNKACIRNKCKDPCVGTCGSNAICSVVNHIPICSCPEKTSGNPFISCEPVKGTFLL